MKRITFTQHLFRNPSDYVNGVVIFENENAEVKYFDDNWIGEFPRPLAISDKLSSAIEGIDVIPYAEKHEEEDTHIVYNLGYDIDSTVIIINPNEAWVDTLVRRTGCYIEEAPKGYRVLSNVGEVIDIVTEELYDYVGITSPMTATLEKAGTGECFKVHFGDAELLDGFIKSVEHSATIGGA